MKRAVAVAFCLGLVVTLCVVFTRVIAARVPEQRATLEKLITDRTGLDVRFDNVRFAWDLDGTSAVFTRVELTDPKRGRVHVLAPELRVEFDTWDFLRHHQFSLGHVTLSSPDIEIIGDPEDSLVQTVTPRAARPTQPGVRADEVAVVNRYLGWASLMPSGRIEVEGARVHLRRRGDAAARHSFTLSQAVVSRTGKSFSAYGTMLLSQDVGQSLFVSAKLDGLDAGTRLSGDLRLIARRVFLDRVPVPGLTGRGTLDARLALKNGRVSTATWQANARELVVNDGRRFDHLTVNGALSRDADDVLLDLTDLQLTRGARLERAPVLRARLRLDPDLKIARTTVHADRIPFMAAEFVAALLAPQTSHAFPALPGDWLPTAGELRDVEFDSGARRAEADGWQLSARILQAELTRSTDHAMFGPIAARMRRDAAGLTVTFDATAPAALRLAATQAPRELKIEGVVASLPRDGAWRFENFSVSDGERRLGADGEWHPGEKRAAPLRVVLAQVDHTLLRDLWAAVARDPAVPEPWSQLEQGVIPEGTMDLRAAEDGTVNWQLSRGTLHLADLATTGQDAPRLSAGGGQLAFARGGTQLTLDSGNVEDFAISGARLDWPRSGAPRLHAQLQGRMDSKWLRGVLAAQGLERLHGAVVLEADARGERELRQPESWRVTARLSGATVALAEGLPPLEDLGGTLRYSAQQVRGLALRGNWLGGPVEIESRRTGARGMPTLAISGVADAEPLLGLLGGAEAAGEISGQFAWTGTLQPAGDEGAWQVSLNSTLAGVESRLPAPFDKVRARNIPVSAELRIAADGLREFNIDGRELEVRGEVRAGVTTARFEVRGVSGELHRGAGRGADPRIRIAQLDLEHAPAVLAASGAWLPRHGELALDVTEVRSSGRVLGSLQASVTRQDAGIDFSLDTPPTALHQVSARGRCDTGGHCRAEFSADTAQLAALLRGVSLPAEWPATSLRAAGTLDWPAGLADVHALGGSFEIAMQGLNAEHQMTARGTLSDGQVLLTDLQGTGPAPDEVFRGTGRIGLEARDYDVSVDYERVALAATAVPSTARARVTRAWNVLRGSAARHGLAATANPETRRVQWHGSWD
ncbi:MAG TPA: hypothetical protein VJP84_01715 [Steroidobacteraceae bacterium]|nr:hypothetical protein [Steroidobacteraceae bacterium]